MKKFFATLIPVLLLINSLIAQEYFTIRQYDVDVKINKNASLDITENIQVHFTENRHGIYRFIPFKYPLQSLPKGTGKADRQLESGGYAHTIVENIQVDGFEYSVNTEGDYKSVKIGSADKVVDGDQQYTIHYRILNAINFFDDHSELYFNIIGNRWNTTIDSVNFSVELPNALPAIPESFVATGSFGSKENNTDAVWNNSKIFSGHSTKQLNNNEGLSLGISFPKDFLVQEDYRFLGFGWMLLPLGVFTCMFFIWRRWGKDEKITVQTEYYPPENISPSVAGYIIDDKLDRRDLTALVPYWGAGGYLQVKETEKTALFGMIKNKEYAFTKVKELPGTAMSFERTLFNGIFASGNNVMLNDLKDVLYTTMAVSKKELEAEVDRGAYFEKGSRGLGYLFVFTGIALLIYGIIAVLGITENTLWYGIAIIASAVFILGFGFLMSKRTEKGTTLYQKLAGFKEFIKSVEKDRLQQFLKEDEHYFDKVLPYAIVFNMADTWKDKLKGLEIPPPQWYSGNYTTFNTMLFLNSLDHSMNQMSNNFYSSPSSSSSGSSFGGGGGFSGGGFGGGGGSSW